MKWVDYKNDKYLFSTTGYTGSAGGEVIILGDESNIKDKAVEFWNMLFEKQIVPCSLG